jgi:acetyl esterase/lipase
VYLSVRVTADPIGPIVQVIGDLDGSTAPLGPLVVFSKTRDLLNPDARRLVARAARAGVTVEYHEAPGMVHVYPLLPIPEGRAARLAIRRTLAQ